MPVSLEYKWRYIEANTTVKLFIHGYQNSVVGVYNAIPFGVGAGDTNNPKLDVTLTQGTSQFSRQQYICTTPMDLKPRSVQSSGCRSPFAIRSPIMRTDHEEVSSNGAESNGSRVAWQRWADCSSGATHVCCGGQGHSDPGS